MLRRENRNQTNLRKLVAKLCLLALYPALWLSCAPPTLNRSASGSSTTTAATISRLNLEVPVELLDVGIQDSAGVTKIWSLSTTTIDASAYDGNPTYYFEAITDNFADLDLTNDTLQLIDSTGVVRSTITVIAGSPTTRYRASFTPNAGSDTYRLRTIGTGNFKVYAARVLIQQTQATKTRIYIPLSSGTYNAAATSDTAVTISNGAFVSSTTTLGYWRKDSSALSTLKTTTPWTFEAVLAHSSAGATAAASLFDAAGNQVTSSQVSMVGTTLTLVTASFADNATNFANATDFEVRVGSTAGICFAMPCARLYKAGLWVTLEGGLSKAQAYYRNQKSMTVATGSNMFTENQRVYLDSTLFSNPTIYYEITALQSTDAASSTGRTATHGTNDTGTGGAVTIGSTDAILATANAKERARSIAVSGMTAGDRFIFHHRCLSDANCTWIHGWILVNASSN